MRLRSPSRNLKYPGSNATRGRVLLAGISLLLLVGASATAQDAPPQADRRPAFGPLVDKSKSEAASNRRTLIRWLVAGTTLCSLLKARSVVKKGKEKRGKGKNRHADPPAIPPVSSQSGPPPMPGAKTD